MGVIIINVPIEIKEKFVIEEQKTANEILEFIKSKLEKKETKKESPEVVGIWKDRFIETSEEIQKEWRRKLWQKF